MLRRLTRTRLLDEFARRPPVIYGRLRNDIAAVDRMDIQARRRLQESLLGRSLRLAKDVPFYRDLPAWNSYDGLPVLQRTDLRGKEARFERRTRLPKARAATGGSTGTPLRIARSPYNVAFEQAMIDSVISAAGVEARSARIAVLRGDTIKDPEDRAPPFWRIADRNKVLLSAHHLSAANYLYYHKFLCEFRPDIITAYPSALQHFLHLAEECGRACQFRLAVTSSEQLPHGLRAGIRRTFGGELLDYYGQAERVSFAWSIEDGVYWFRPDYGLVELHPDGAEFRAIASGLQNSAQILLRYDMGDKIEIDGSPDAETLEAISLGIAPFARISGRQSEYIVLPDGARIIGLNHIPRGVDGVASVQFVQEEPTFVRIHVVKGAGYSEHALKHIESNFRQKVPNIVRFSWEFGDQPIRLPSGKAPLYIKSW
jgi:phenylacetate-CoA ligase